MISEIQHKSTRYKEVATAISVLVLSLSIAAAAELLLRFERWNRGIVSIQRVEDSSGGLQSKAPDMNALRFRGQDIETAKPPHVVRIAFFGSSSTRDVYSTQDETTWPHQAWATLQQLFPECHFEYVNAGQNGFGVSAMKELYDYRVARLEPDVVVIAANDLVKDLQTLDENAAVKRNKDELSLLGRYSLLWHYIETSSSRIRRLRNEKVNRTDIHYLPSEVLARSYEEHLARFVDEIKSDGRIPVLVIIPKMIRKQQNNAKRSNAARRLYLDLPFIDLDEFFKYEDFYNNVFSKMSESSGAILIDARNAIPGNEINYIDSYHLAPPGSARLGQLVGSELARSSTVRNRIIRVFPECLE